MLHFKIIFKITGPFFTFENLISNILNTCYLVISNGNSYQNCFLEITVSFKIINYFHFFLKFNQQKQYHYL